MTKDTQLARRMRRILLLLPIAIRNPGVTLAELAERLGATEAELLSDLQLLFVCGLPGYGPGDLIDVAVEDGRVFVGTADYFSAPLRLTPPEALALYASAKAVGALEGMDQADALRRALVKLGKALETAGARAEPRDAVEVTLGNDPVPHLRVIEDALARRRRLELDYFTASRGEMTRRRIDPWGLFTALGHWYLIAFDHARKEERMFRLDRIRTAEVIDEQATVPEDFDPGRYRGAFTGRGRLEMSLEVSPEIARWFADHYPVGSARPLEDGWQAVTLVAGTPRWAAVLLLKLGAGVRRVKPPSVTAAARELAARILTRYETDASSS